MYSEITTFLKEAGFGRPRFGIILGSGLGSLADEIEDPIALSFDAIPHFPQSTVQGHKGQLIYGDLAGEKVVVLYGRFHYYEGHSLDAVTLPVRIFNELGVETLVVTNAAGGINANFSPGDLMVIRDHINITGQNPLIGPHTDRQGPRFVDMTQAYSDEAVALLRGIAQDEGYHLQEGVYCWTTGPTYETPAEIHMMRTLGADAAGMSTVPEVIVAKQCGMEVVGISCITNMAAGMQETLNHEEVLETSKRVTKRFEQLIKRYIEIA